ncbi:Uncharacterized protein TCM_039133 [Theobroma cacao]|uniref:Uncharacterized protein n=1 Tax=Theobroma cacao TaxID=3641 RepID=A0A061GPS5_THECC|nr:Uncharacterized protein TCM_039133 [Theobroma cacao]
MTMRLKEILQRASIGTKKEQGMWHSEIQTQELLHPKRESHRWIKCLIFNVYHV